MAFDNQYPKRKDHRKPYTKGPKRFDRACRNHGSCHYCSAGRKFFDKKRRDAADLDLLDGLKELIDPEDKYSCYDH